MSIILNPGDANLPAVAGIVLDLTAGHELPMQLFVFGIGDHGENDIFIDDVVPNVNSITAFLAEQGVNISIGLPDRPRMRPAVGISRRMREHNVQLAAKVCAFILFCMHETILLPGGMEQIAANLQT